MEKKTVGVAAARYRKSKSYQRDMARALMGKPIRAFIKLRGQDAFYGNPVLADLKARKGNN
jgi:hypothetical protein